MKKVFFVKQFIYANFLILLSCNVMPSKNGLSPELKKAIERSVFTGLKSQESQAEEFFSQFDDSKINDEKFLEEISKICTYKEAGAKKAEAESNKKKSIPKGDKKLTAHLKLLYHNGIKFLFGKKNSKGYRTYNKAEKIFLDHLIKSEGGFLECPVCFSGPKKMVYCPNSHFVCFDCYGNLVVPKKCVLCRMPFVDNQNPDINGYDLPLLNLVWQNNITTDYEPDLPHPLR